MNKDEALQIALEALTDFDYDKRMSAIKVIKEALKTKDEPVAWMSEDEHTVYTSKQVDGCFQHDHIPLYTTPQRTWVVLTDEEMRELEKQFEAERVRTSDEEYLVIYPAAYWQWQRAIEAKLKEKNT